MLLAVGTLLELIPGESKFGPELYCCYRIPIKQTTTKTHQKKTNNQTNKNQNHTTPKNSNMPVEMLWITLGTWLRERLPAPSRLAQLQPDTWQTVVSGLMDRASQEAGEGKNQFCAAGPHPEASSLLIFSCCRLLQLLLGVRCQVSRQTWDFLLFFI